MGQVGQGTEGRGGLTRMPEGRGDMQERPLGSGGHAGGGISRMVAWEEYENVAAQVRHVTERLHELGRVCRAGVAS